MKFIQYLVVFGIAFSMFSCTIKEEITINEDGSGEYSTALDLNQTKSFMTDLVENFSDKDSLKAREKRGEQKEMNQDTLIHFKDILEEKKDSIATLSQEEQLALRALETYSMRIKISEEEDSYMKIFTPFTSISQVQNGFGSFLKATEIVKGKNEGGMKKIDSPFSSSIVGSLSLAFNGKKFSRKSIQTNQNQSAKEQKEYEKMITELEDKKDEMAMMFNDESYQLVYHFPKPIKKINIKDATFSADRKTVYINRNYLEYLLNPEMLDLKITLEK